MYFAPSNNELYTSLTADFTLVEDVSFVKTFRTLRWQCNERVAIQTTTAPTWPQTRVEDQRQGRKTSATNDRPERQPREIGLSRGHTSTSRHKQCLIIILCVNSKYSVHFTHCRGPINGKTGNATELNKYNYWHY